MGNKLTIKQKREWAEILVAHTQMNQKEISEKVETTPKTMSSWWKKYNWDQLRTSFFITRGQELQRIYRQISELNNEISERPKRWEDQKAKNPNDKTLPMVQPKPYANSKEADTLTKLSSAAKNLESEVSVAETIDVFMNFTNWLREVEFEKAKEFTDYMDEYIKTKL